jgi:NAD(P)-dependent dehydrogenase (short-subunit alcohol dehydrogenase family)
MTAFTDDELKAALKVLAAVNEDRGVLAHVERPVREELQRLAGQIARPDLKQRKQMQKALARKERLDKKAHDDEKRRSTGIQQLRAQPVFVTPTLGLPPMEAAQQTETTEEHEEEKRLHDERKCYVCKQPYSTLHPFYDQLCKTCGDLNFAKRTATVDLSGRVAIVTGARVKIGYQTAILMLRAGCTVVALTRFPRDAAKRYASEADFPSWKHRLHVYGIDLRHTPSVEHLSQHLASTLPRLDFQIHNACQTVRRPPGFYGHLLGDEKAPLPALAAPLVARYEEHRAVANHEPALLTQAKSEADLVLHAGESASAEIFPKGVLDQDLQQVDLRTHNSWRLTLGDVPTLELLEVLLVNAAAPFVMASKLKSLMLRDREPPHGTDPAKHIVMVSAMEGQFYRAFKTDKHPHTNMAKAALNMLVRTSAQDYAKDGIYLNAVDTGWVTDEDPAQIAKRKVEEHGFSPPLDIVDGAARIVDPIFEGFRTGQHPAGFFFKDYAPARW